MNFNENDKTLNMLKQDEIAWIKSINLDGTIRRRLQDLGIITGTQIKCQQKIKSGNPTAFQVRGTTIALRTEDSKNILVSFKPLNSSNKEDSYGNN